MFKDLKSSLKERLNFVTFIWYHYRNNKLYSLFPHLSNCFSFIFHSKIETNRIYYRIIFLSVISRTNKQICRHINVTWENHVWHPKINSNHKIKMIEIELLFGLTLHFYHTQYIVNPFSSSLVITFSRLYHPVYFFRVTKEIQCSVYFKWLDTNNYHLFINVIFFKWWKRCVSDKEEKHLSMIIY